MRGDHEPSARGRFQESTQTREKMSVFVDAEATSTKIVSIQGPAGSKSAMTSMRSSKHMRARSDPAVKHRGNGIEGLPGLGNTATHTAAKSEVTDLKSRTDGMGELLARLKYISTRRAGLMMELSALQEEEESIVAKLSIAIRQTSLSLEITDPNFCTRAATTITANTSNNTTELPLIGPFESEGHQDPSPKHFRPSRIKAPRPISAPAKPTPPAMFRKHRVPLADRTPAPITALPMDTEDPQTQPIPTRPLSSTAKDVTLSLIRPPSSSTRKPVATRQVPTNFSEDFHHPHAIATPRRISARSMEGIALSRSGSKGRSRSLAGSRVRRRSGMEPATPRAMGSEMDGGLWDLELGSGYDVPNTVARKKWDF